ncbi:hypothetical protein Tco_0752368 [Tanacetum coccineum]|uniref:Uncharacterized protein n=1 Tax=Tanacetum coccineum TaxID=301880 RepID=A0ABQ4Z9Z6_9ASTR
MTRNITTPPMELDLDSFLQSEDDEDDVENDHIHRTALDELLLTDSDDSTAFVLFRYHFRSLLSKFTSSVSGVSVGESYRQLPPLFGSVRSSAKPGAALAAAAADTWDRYDVEILVMRVLVSFAELDVGSSLKKVVLQFRWSRHVDAIEDDGEPVSVSSEKDASESLVTNEKDAEFGNEVEGDDDGTVPQTDVSVDLTEKKDEKTPERPSLKPLELAEELEKKHAFTGLHWEEGAAAQPMKLEGVHGGSTVLGYFSVSSDNTITKIINAPNFKRDHGTPQVLAVHLNYIAIGMSRGLIVVFPSKYSPHYPDNMDTQMLMLGLISDKSYAPVTSMSFNHKGDHLFAGYADWALSSLG